MSTARRSLLGPWRDGFLPAAHRGLDGWATLGARSASGFPAKKGLGAGTHYPPRACGPWPSAPYLSQLLAGCARRWPLLTRPAPIGRAGPVCWDNAATQSCWSTLKTELCSRHSWPTKARETTHRRPLDRGALQPPPTPLSADHDDPSRVSGGVGCQPRGRIGRRGSMPDEQLP